MAKPAKLTIALCSRIYDLACDTPEPELYGAMLSYLQMAADRIRERMIESGRITLEDRGGIAQDIISGLQCFVDRLKSGEPIETTRIERIETPDGPMHVRTKGTL